MVTATALSIKEIWRNKGRFLLIAMVIALITTLVLFVAGLAEGLGSGQKEYIEKLNADLLLYQENVELTIPSSTLGWSRINDVQRVPNVADVGPLGFSRSTIVAQDLDPNSLLEEALDISIVGVEPGRPGEPEVERGRQLGGRRVNETLIDRNLALQTGFEIGDSFTIKTVQGTLEEFYTFEIVGITDERRYGLAPSAFLPFLTWDEVKPRGAERSENAELTFNILAVRLNDRTNFTEQAEALVEQVGNVEYADLQTAYESIPGYQPQQSTLGTQRTFSLLIGLLVIGGFFQIQTLQKVAQIGMLKAIGASNTTVVITSLIQIVLITILGVSIGALGTLVLSLNFPVTVPIVFTPEAVFTTVITLLLIGPIGGLVSIRTLLKVEPLAALGLAQ